MTTAPAPLTWLGIARLGCVQAALGAIVVLTTSTLNRVMVVELALPAIVPGSLVALHYIAQVLRPRLGYGSDTGGRRTPWIIGGMALLTAGGIGAAGATVLMATHLAAGIALALLAFLAVGIGVGASGTSLLVLLAKRVAPARRAPAATIVWLMMIAGIAITATIGGKLLQPFSPERLMAVATVVAIAALLMTLLAVWGMEGTAALAAATAPAAPQPRFMTALGEVWREAQARRFAIFVFVSMLGYSAQELVLEPFAGAVFGLAPGESTRLTGLQHGGVLAGMLLVAFGGSLAGEFRAKAMRAWTMGGCAASALALLVLAAGGLAGPGFPLQPAVFVLGAANGAFAVSAIGAMMGLAGQGRESREGVRMGLWGAAQALAFGLGGLFGTGASDVARAVLGAPDLAYAAVFCAEAVIFLAAAWLAASVFQSGGAVRSASAPAIAAAQVN